MKNNMIKLSLIAVFTTALFFIGCGKGLTPYPEAEGTGASGTIEFTSPWPDSIKRVHFAVFDSTFEDADDFNLLNLKYVSLAIPPGTSFISYNTFSDSALINAIAAGDYEYAAVVASAAPALSLVREAWFVAGVYYAGSNINSPGKFIVRENQITTGINIKVDFNNLPPQPLGGAE